MGALPLGRHFLMVRVGDRCMLRDAAKERVRKDQRQSW